MNHDVFISYSTKNKVIADALCHYLEEQQIRCWIAPRDIPPGMTYANQIDSAIINCKVFVILYSKDSATSKWCPSEVDIAVNENKVIIPFRIDSHPLQKEMRLYLGSLHWIDACPNPEMLFGNLCNSIRAILNQDESAPAGAAASPSPAPSAKQASVSAPPEKKAGKSWKLYLALVPVLLIVLALAALQVKSLVSSSEKGGNDPAVASTSTTTETPARGSTPATGLTSSLRNETAGAQPSTPVNTATESIPAQQESAAAQTSSMPATPATEKASESAKEPKVLNVRPGSLLSVYARNQDDNTFNPKAAPLAVIVDDNTAFDISSLAMNPETNQKFVSKHNGTTVFSRSLFLVWDGYIQIDAEDTYSFSLVSTDFRRSTRTYSAEVYFSKETSPCLSISFSSRTNNSDVSSCSRKLTKGAYKIRVVWKIVSNNFAPPSFLFEYRRQSDPTNTVQINPSNMVYESPSE